MRLILGPAGSGKTESILAEFREALRAKRSGIRLLVPTATLAEHLQNRLAREGLIFRRSLVQTFSRFVQPWVEDTPEVSDAVLYLLVEEAARRVNRREFARVVQLPGFCAALTRTINELSSSGCGAARLAAHMPDAALGPAFLAVYQEVDRELERRGLWLRGRRLERAAERIRKHGSGGIDAIWLDGFHALPDPELGVLAALDGHAKVTIALHPRDLTDGIRAIGYSEQGTASTRSNPHIALVRAPSIEREVEEIARRILDEASAGRPFREIGVIVRPAESYVPLLRSTLERFGIPAHFYFDQRLEEHAAIRYVTGAVEAMLSGWDHSAVLGVLRLAPLFADSNELDWFDFRVREQIPNAGLDGLRALCGSSERLLQQLDALASIEEWRGLSMTAKSWASRLSKLRNLFRPSTFRTPDRDLAMIWRSQATALDEFDRALEEVSAALDPTLEIGLERFWSALKAVLRLKPLRLADDRRNVVHVLSAHEARLWLLPVVFICGLVEKQFPQLHRQDPFLPDSARMGLNAAGIRVRTAAEFEREEGALFDTAITRATTLVILSYPQFDARGDRTLPSLFLAELRHDHSLTVVAQKTGFDFTQVTEPRASASGTCDEVRLDRILLTAEDAQAVRPVPRSVLRTGESPARIQNAKLLEYLRERTARLSPSDLEAFLQCPFQYFGSRLLKLQSAPPRPEERLDFRMQGSIVHEVLAAWWKNRSSVEPLFEEAFNRVCQKHAIPVAYHTERLRNSMLRDLIAFTTDPKASAAGGESRTEEKFAYELNESLIISGRIDRLDVTPNGARVTDYKYSASVKARLQNPNLLQAPLYLLAADRYFGMKALGMDYIGLKGGVKTVGWEIPFPENFFEQAIEKTLHAADQIRNGRIEPFPADPSGCRYCDFRDACRVETQTVPMTADDAVEVG